MPRSGSQSSASCARAACRCSLRPTRCVAWPTTPSTSRASCARSTAPAPRRALVRRARLQAWGDRARRELRASGESSRRRDPSARDRLTAQELQIAQLAADGLTNREIGQRLYLSHRTIATHLYRSFPKLGVTARSQLGAALSAGGRPS